MVCAVIGLVFAFFLIAAVVRSPSGNERMREISGAVQEGAKAYLNRQVITISSIAVIIFILLFIFKDRPTAIGFVIGAFCSLSAGYIGMRIAVIANVRTTQAATVSITKALRMAFNGGAVTGLLVVGLALLAVSIFYSVVAYMIGPQMAINSLVGLALGASLISVFARLGGGIYTKAADVGADLVGKIEKGLEEDDPRNPATIADNVGDNVGDCAGMAADVFETYAVSLIGAILVGALTLPGNPAAVVYPFVLGGISVLGAILGVLFVNVAGGKPATVLMGGVVTSAIVSAVFFWPATHYLFPTGVMIAGQMRSPTQLYWASVVGLSHDSRCRGDHQLLHVDALSARAKNCPRLRDRSCDEHYRRPGCWSARHRVASWLYCNRHFAEFSFWRPLRNRHCRDGDAVHGRDHHLARFVRSDYR